MTARPLQGGSRPVRAGSGLALSLTGVSAVVPMLKRLGRQLDS